MTLIARPLTSFEWRTHAYRRAAYYGERAIAYAARGLDSEAYELAAMAFRWCREARPEVCLAEPTTNAARCLERE